MNDLNSNLDETDKIQDVFRQVDRDGDGEISFMEFFTKLPTIMGWVNPVNCFTDSFTGDFNRNRRISSAYGATRFR